MNASTVSKLFCLFAIVSLAGISLADGPSPAPAPSTTTAPFVPHIAVIPPGLHLVTVGELNFYCLPEDDAWVKSAAAAVKPTSRPTTMPSDLAASLKQHRDEILAQIGADFGLADTKAVSTELDTKLDVFLDKVSALKPHIYFLPVTHAKLNALMKAGWTDPRYYYNRYGEDAEYDPTRSLELSAEYTMDDLVVWIEMKEDDTPDQRSAALAKTINLFNNRFLVSLSELGLTVTRNVLGDVILSQAIDPLKLPENLTWFGKGIAAVYAIKYSSIISGANRDSATKDFMTDDPRNPLHSQPMDLLHPLPMDGLNPRYKSLYLDGQVRKGTSVVYAWVLKGGDGVVTKTLPKLRPAPADAEGLAKVVKDATGIDLTEVMKPNYKVQILEAN